MKKNTQFLAVFMLTLLLGLWSGSFFERHIVSFGFVQNFSVSEVENLKGKTVRQTCGLDKQKLGKITAFSRSKYGLIRVRIVWNDADPAKWYEVPKNCFSKCYEIVE